MATPTYTLLDSVTLASSAASVTFSSIDQSYGDLVVVVSGAGTPAGDDVRIILNGDTAGNYYVVNAFGTGSSTGSNAISGQNRIDLFGSWSSVFDNLGVIQLMDYSATDKHKSILLRTNNVTSSRVAMTAARWANTAAITSVEVKFPSYSFQAGSTFHLYGIAKAL